MEALDIADALMVALNFWHGHGGDSLAADRSGSETELVDGPVSGSQQEVLMLSRLTPLEQMCAVSGAIAHAAVRERSCAKLAAYWYNIRDCGGTMLVAKTPVRDLRSIGAKEHG